MGTAGTSGWVRRATRWERATRVWRPEGRVEVGVVGVVRQLATMSAGVVADCRRASKSTTVRGAIRRTRRSRRRPPAAPCWTAAVGDRADGDAVREGQAGVGFAVAVDDLMQVVPSLITCARSRNLGAAGRSSFRSSFDESDGIITSSYEGSPAPTRPRARSRRVVVPGSVQPTPSRRRSPRSPP